MEALKEAKTKKSSLSVLRHAKSDVNNPKRHTKKNEGHGILIDELTGRTTMNVSILIMLRLVTQMHHWFVVHCMLMTFVFGVHMFVAWFDV